MSDYLILCSDLFFTSKVGGTAQMIGINAKTVMNVDAAIEEIKTNENLKGLILDLTVPGLNLEVFLDFLPEIIKKRTIAFGPHVETESLKLATEKGCAAVLPRSKFSSELPSILKQYFTEENS